MPGQKLGRLAQLTSRGQAFEDVPAQGILGHLEPKPMRFGLHPLRERDGANEIVTDNEIP
jgi:hypothetical protein